jgi:hypothetical protein
MVMFVLIDEIDVLLGVCLCQPNQFDPQPHPHIKEYHLLRSAFKLKL